MAGPTDRKQISPHPLDNTPATEGTRREYAGVGVSAPENLPDRLEAIAPVDLLGVRHTGIGDLQPAYIGEDRLSATLCNAGIYEAPS